MIEVEHVAKSYGPVKALNDVSFKIAKGEIVGLLGPNGAGKTTMIKILTGYLQPDEGRVTVAGLDVLTQTKAAEQHIGYLPETAPLYPELSIQQYLKLVADLRHIPEEEQLERISEAVYAVDVEKYLTRPIGHLSKGYRQRVGIAQAMLHKPDLLILDEPTIGLDPTQIVEIRKLVKRLAQHSTILFSTHILPEVELLCDRAIILMSGQIRADSRLSDLAATSNVILIMQEKTNGVSQALRALKGVSRVEEMQAQGGFMYYRINAETKSDLSPAVYQLAVENKWPVRELRHDVRTLEMVFNELAVAE